MTENKLRNEIEKIYDKYKDSSYVNATDELLVLIEDVVCEFNKFYERTSVVYGSPNKAVTYFINHFYKPKQ